MSFFSKNIISDKTLIKEAIEILNTLSGKDNHTLFVVNDLNKLVGTVSDGDIRRSMLAKKTITDSVTEAMNLNYRFVKVKQFTLEDINNLKKKEITLVPLLGDNNELLKIFDLNNSRSILPLDAIIMAGGEGRRLRPMTEKLPKPLLKVGDKPIIEYNIDHLEKFGIDTIHVSVNYLGDLIKNYLKDGSEKGIKINYCEEKKPLGTLGSAKLVKEFSNDVILVMNSDLLTNINYEDFYTEFISKGADMAVATIPYNISVPYAVIETNDDRVISLKEKPTYTYQSNAGIYLIKKELFDFIPADEVYNATDLMERVIAEKKKLICFPLYCYWLDIGSPNDFMKAQEDCKHIKF